MHNRNQEWHHAITSLIYRTLLQRIKTSPKFPDNSPSMYSSVSPNYKTFTSSIANHTKAYLKVHVRVNSQENALVFHTPLELDNDRLSRLTCKKWLWVYNTLIKRTIRKTIHSGKGKTYRHYDPNVLQTCVVLRGNRNRVAVHFLVVFKR